MSPLRLIALVKSFRTQNAGGGIRPQVTTVSIPYWYSMSRVQFEKSRQQGRESDQFAQRVFEPDFPATVSCFTIDVVVLRCACCGVAARAEQPFCRCLQTVISGGTAGLDPPSALLRCCCARVCTTIAVCRRLIQAVVDRRTAIHLVKVKGHSEHEGNEAADTCATWAQNGGANGEQNIARAMEHHW
jgi:hypothetical protein